MERYLREFDAHPFAKEAAQAAILIAVAILAVSLIFVARSRLGGKLK